MRFIPTFAAFGVVISACSSSPSTNPAVTPSGSALPFTPSNITLAGIDLTKLGDEDVSQSCQIQTQEGGASDCFLAAADKTVVQSDGSKVHVYVVKSLRVEPTTHITVSGGLPLVLVSLGDFNLLGTIDAHAKLDAAGPGGFGAIAKQKGSGAGGGAAATGTAGAAGAGAGGASGCGVGGAGSIETGVATAPGASSPAAGTPTLIPLTGGSSGGGGEIGGGGGGGALQLISGATLTMAAGSYINVGGGGGIFGGLATGQEAGGGGAGGVVLIEAPTVKTSGTIAANGGGGGGKGGSAATAGADGAADSVPPAGGTPQPGGNGGAGTSIDGTAAGSGGGGGGGGGGGAGRIRINTSGGKVDLSSATISPATTTTCVTQGVVKS